jgi:hypothetical protein
MKKRIFAILAVAALAITIPANAFAAEPETLPEPGMTPANGFYFMETWMQHLNMAFTFGAEAKLQKALHYAGEKLAEMETLAEQNQAQHMEKSANQYRYYLNTANRNMEQALNGDNGTSERVAKMMARHIAVMTQYQNNESEDCQQIRTRTRLQAEECQENAVCTLAGQNAEEAIKLNLALMEQQRERIQNMVGQADGEEIEEALQQCERIQNMNQEMIANCEQFGLGPEAQQRLQQAIATQEGVLNQIRNQYQNGNGGSVDSPVQNQVQEQQDGTTTNYDIENNQNGSGPMGPAPNSGDGISDGSGFEEPNGANGNTYGKQ